MESKGAIESISLKNSASYISNNLTTNNKYFCYASNIDVPILNVV
jgi:hypothetical protein